MRMSALVAAAGLTPSRITRVVDGLAHHGMVRKERPDNDGRGNDAVLTDTGLHAMRSAQATAALEITPASAAATPGAPGPDPRTPE